MIVESRVGPTRPPRVPPVGVFEYGSTGANRRTSIPHARDIRIGTSGLAVWQPSHSQLFPVVEIKLSTGHLPPLSAVQRWRRDAPEESEFAIKASPLITHPPRRRAPGRGRGAEFDGSHGHFRDAPAVRKAWKDTLHIAQALRAHLIVFQCPGSFRPTEANIANLCRFVQWAHRDRIRLGLEVRHEQWTDELLWDLCRELSLTHVVDPFTRPSVRPRPAYFRLRGAGDRHRRYADADLLQLLKWCDGDPTYCLFSNAEDAAQFRSLIDSMPDRQSA